MDKDTKNDSYSVDIKIFIESLVLAVAGVDVGQESGDKGSVLTQKTLNIFHESILSYAEEKSHYEYFRKGREDSIYYRLKEAYKSKDKSIFEIGEISLLFKDACDNFIEKTRSLLVPNLEDEF